MKSVDVNYEYFLGCCQPHQHDYEVSLKGIVDVRLDYQAM